MPHPLPFGRLETHILGIQDGVAAAAEMLDNPDLTRKSELSRSCRDEAPAPVTS